MITCPFHFSFYSVFGTKSSHSSHENEPFSFISHIFYYIVSSAADPRILPGTSGASPGREPQTAGIFFSYMSSPDTYVCKDKHALIIRGVHIIFLCAHLALTCQKGVLWPRETMCHSICPIVESLRALFS